jgi:hypothetical protein
MTGGAARRDAVALTRAADETHSSRDLHGVEEKL